MPLQKIDELNLEVDLNSSEGLDINYISRIRSQYLFTQHQTMITQMQFADAKAAALIALIGFVSLRGPIKITEIINIGLFGYLFLIFAGLGVIFSLLAIFPRYPSRERRDTLVASDRWSWPALASKSLKPEEFASYMLTSEVSQLLNSLSISNSLVADILLSKYQMLRIGFICGFLTVFLVGLKVVAFV